MRYLVGQKDYSTSTDYIINEGVSDYVFTYNILKALGKPFKRWDAFKNGLINKDGRLLRTITQEDRNTHWGYYERVCWNLKKILNIVTIRELSPALLSLYLIKEGISKEVSTKILEDLNESNSIILEDIEITHAIKFEYIKIKKELI